MDLRELLRRPEGKTLEFKREVDGPQPFLRTVVAFANTAGGEIVVGVDDGTARVRGVPDSHALGERLASLVTDSIEPRVLPDLETHDFRGRAVLVVRVHPSDARPHCLRAEGAERGTYVRVGSTNRRADASLREEMARYARGESFDERPVPDLDSEVIDFRVASELFRDHRRLRRPDLVTLRLLTRHQSRLVPTVGGVLLLGNREAEHFPDARLQVGRFDGVDRSHIADHQTITGTLPSLVYDAVAFVEKHALRSVRVRRVRHDEHWSVPPVAVREAIVNAVVHADYAQPGAPLRVAIFDDRIEIENPGLLPFGLTVDDLPLGTSKVRNRVIARVFHELRLIEQWGSGIQRMIAACRGAGLAAPRFEEIGTRFRATIPTVRVSAPVVDDVERRILSFLAHDGGRATHEVANHIGLSARATRTRLAALVDRGLVRELGTGPQDPRRRYVLAAG